MSFYKKTYYQAVSIFPLPLLLKLSQAGILLPYQHLVSDVMVKHIRHLFLYKNKRQFIKDLDYLLTHFRPVHPAELIQAARTGLALPKDGFLLSFDDGLREVYDHVAPILLGKGVPAIFFLNPAFLDNRALFYRCKLSLLVEALLQQQPKRTVIGRVNSILHLQTDDLSKVRTAILQINYLHRELADQLGECLQISFQEYLAQEQPYLLTGQVKELIRKGFHVGAHSMDHPNYKLLSLEQQLFQTKESCRWIRETFEQSYSFFSFPHEDASVKQEFFDNLLKPGESPVDWFFGTQNQNTEYHNRVLHRFNAERPGYPWEGLIKGTLLYNVKKREIKRQ